LHKSFRFLYWLSIFTNYVPLETLAINSVVGQQAGAVAEVGHANASLAAEAKGKQYQPVCELVYKPESSKMPVGRLELYAR